MKKLKNVFWLAAIAASAVVVSCEKDGDDANGNGSFVIKATVSTGNTDVDAVKVHIDSREDEDVILAEGKYENSGFTIQLPSTVPARWRLWSVSEDFRGAPHIEVSDDNARWSRAYFYAFKGEDYVGEFRYGSMNEAKTEFISVYFTYVDRDVNVTGYDDARNVKKSLFLKKGWNKRYSYVDHTDTTTEPSGLEMEWYWR